MRHIGVSIAALLLAIPAVAQPPVEAEISEKSARDDVFPQAEVAFPGDVVVWPQVEISNLDGFRPVRMDIYAPRAVAVIRAPRFSGSTVAGGAAATRGHRAPMPTGPRCLLRSRRAASSSPRSIIG